MKLLLGLLLACTLVTLMLLRDRRPLVQGPNAEPGAPRDSLQRAHLMALRELGSPALEQRKAARLRLQRAGYLEALASELRGDGAASLASLVRMNAQVEFHLSHRPLSVYFPVAQPTSPVISPLMRQRTSGMYQVLLYEDWSMPEDPWR